MHPAAYISHAEVQVKPLANSPGCLQFTLSTVKFDINPTKAYVVCVSDMVDGALALYWGILGTELAVLMQCVCGRSSASVLKFISIYRLFTTLLHSTYLLA